MGCCSSTPAPAPFSPIEKVQQQSPTQSPTTAPTVKKATRKKRGKKNLSFVDWSDEEYELDGESEEDEVPEGLRFVGRSKGLAWPANEAMLRSSSSNIPQVFASYKGKDEIAAGMERVGEEALALDGKLPPPGHTHPQLLQECVEVAKGALGNHPNLLRMLERALGILKLIAMNKELHGRRDIYCRLMYKLDKRFRDMREYMLELYGRHYLLRLATGFDQVDYKLVWDHLGQLLTDAMAVLPYPVSPEMSAVMDQLDQPLVYKAREEKQLAKLLDNLGGVEATLNDVTKIQKLTAALGSSKYATPLLAKQAVNILLVHQQAGPAQLIVQPKLRVFWYQNFKNRAEVLWEEFWEVFPSTLDKIPMPIPEHKLVTHILSFPAARELFQHRCERRDPVTLDVSEFRSVPAELSITDMVLQYVSPPMGRFIASDGKSSLPPVTLPDGVPGLPGLKQCYVPSVHHMTAQRPVVGRDAEINSVMNKLVSNDKDARVVNIVGTGGVGKTLLAFAVAWELYLQGAATGGANLIDLRGAYFLEAIVSRMMFGLGLQEDQGAKEGDLAAALNREMAASCHLPMIVVVDNASDSLLEDPTGAVLASILARLLKLLPEARLIVTSRKDIHVKGYPVHRLELLPLNQEHSITLARSVAPTLTRPEAARLADLCQGVPLLLRAAADALHWGRTTLRDLHDPEGSQHGSNKLIPPPVTPPPTPSPFKTKPKKQPSSARSVAESSSTLPSSQPNSARPLARLAEQLSELENSMLRRSMSISSNSSGPSEPPATPVASMASPTIRHPTAGSVLSCILATLYPATLEALAALAIFPDQFDANGAAAVLDCPLHQAKATLSALHSHGLLEYRSDTHKYMTHLLVRHEVMKLAHDGAAQGALFTNSTDLLFVRYVLSVMKECNALLRHSNSAGVLMGQEHMGDIMEMMRLVSVCVQHEEDFLPGIGGASALLYEDLYLALDLWRKSEIMWSSIYYATGLTAGMELEHAVAAWSLGEVHIQREQYDIAERYHREAMLIRRDRLHEDHLDRAASKNSLALCLWQQGKSEEAEQLLRRALEIRAKALAEDDPDLNLTLHNLALCMDDVGKHDEAVQTYEKAMTHLEHVPNHVELQLKVVHGPRGEIEPMPSEAIEEDVVPSATSPVPLERQPSTEGPLARKPSLDHRRVSVDFRARKPSMDVARKPSMDASRDRPSFDMSAHARPVENGLASLDRASMSRASESDIPDSPSAASLSGSDLDSHASTDGSGDRVPPLPSFVFSRLEVDVTQPLRVDTTAAALTDPNIAEANGGSPKLHATILRRVELGQPLLKEATTEELASIPSIDPSFLDSHPKPPLGRGLGMKKSTSMMHSLSDLQSGLPAPANAIHKGLLGSLKNLIGRDDTVPAGAADDSPIGSDSD